jgi:1,4-alpha-glucan branching enzyme
MVYRVTSPKSDHVRVVFELPASLWAQLVYVVGDFNGRAPEATLPLRQERDGVWRTVIDLPAGQRYEFRYLIDGRWCCDSHAIGCSTDSISSFFLASLLEKKSTESPKSLVDTTRIEEYV